MRRYFKIIALLLTFLQPAVSSAHDFEMNGVFYNIDNNELTVTFRGETYSSYSNEYSGEVVIPERVIYNGVTYPVTSIGSNAFYWCHEVTNVILPNTVRFIDYCAFYGCTGLKSIFIPNSVTSIGSVAFGYCKDLTSIEVSSGNPIFDSRNNCNAIIETASDKLIAGCKNTIIPNTITFIGSKAFEGCSDLTSIEIPNSVTTIGSSAFWYCSGLTGIEIPNSVTTINYAAFQGCSGLTSIVIPNSVIYIGDVVFHGCTHMESMMVANDNPKFDSRNNCNAIIETASNKLIAGCKNTLIPNTITSIGSNAFSGCSYLRYIEIPNSITTIGNRAFLNCSGLECVIIGNSVATIDNEAFKGCGKLESLYCFSPTPSNCEDDTFTKYSATLHVPAASLAAYFTAPVWSNFESIVGDAIAPTDIVISKDSVEMPLGQQMELTAIVTPTNASCKEVTWYSTDTNVATVDNGIVTATGYGECDIIASCFGMQAICHVSIANRISLDQQETILLPNHMLTLVPSAPAMPDAFVVTSSNPTVAAARVMNGKVEVVGIKEGTTTITVSSADGTAIPATCLVTVYTELGDLNCDGFVNISDVTSLIDYLLNVNDSEINIKNADVNANGSINIADVTTLIDILLNGE